MKLEVIKCEPVFTPIELKITISNEKELCDLWHRLNESPTILNESGRNTLVHGAKTDTGSWNVVDQLIVNNYPHLIK
tara:strand:+ start:42 stop:272 length:231 start_codon:yes stop_codon:yes gene_type:complete